MKTTGYVSAVLLAGALIWGSGCGPAQEGDTWEASESTAALTRFPAPVDPVFEDAGVVEADAGTPGSPDAGEADAGEADAGAADAGWADAGTAIDPGPVSVDTRKKVSCAGNPNKCYSSPEPDCGCRDSDGLCVNAYGQNCEW